MASGIYKIENIVDGKFYIGSAGDISKRWQNHVRELNSNKHLRFAWQKYGSENFQFAIVEYCEKEQLLEREQFYLDATKACSCGYNFFPVAGSNRGATRTAEWNRNRSLSMKGKMASEETKKKMSVSQKIRRLRPDQRLPRPKEVVDKIRATMFKKGQAPWNKGVKATEEVRERLSTAAKGKIVSLETRRKLSEAALTDWKRRKQETAGYGKSALQSQGG